MLHIHRQRLTPLLAVTLLAACVTQPTPYKHGLVPSAKRVLARDFSARATAAQINRLRNLPKLLGTELLRAETVLSVNQNGHAKRELMRANRIVTQATKAIDLELRRYPDNFSRFWPTRLEFSQDVANNLATAAHLIGPRKRVMQEITDQVHRTDHTDRRPELTWWQRLFRRLPL